MNPTFDERDAALLAERTAVRAKLAGPQVGDWIVMLDGTTRRFTHNWDDGLQTTCAKPHPCAEDQSFYLDKSGYMSFSGSLDAAIPLGQIEDTGETRDARCWIFHHGQVGAHRAVYGQIPCRVYRQVPQ